MEVRKQIIQIRVNTKEKDKIMTNAHYAGMSVSTYMRWKALK